MRSRLTRMRRVRFVSKHSGKWMFVRIIPPYSEHLPQRTHPKLVKPHVLVVDEVGDLGYGTDAANVLFHVVGERHMRRCLTIFTTNKNPKRWGPVLHDNDLAEAIVDRILERGRLLKLDGPSIRTKHLPDLDLLPDDSTVEASSRASGTEATESPEPHRAISSASAKRTCLAIRLT